MWYRTLSLHWRLFCLPSLLALVISQCQKLLKLWKSTKVLMTSQVGYLLSSKMMSDSIMQIKIVIICLNGTHLCSNDWRHLERLPWNLCKTSGLQSLTYGRSLLQILDTNVMTDIPRVSLQCQNGRKGHLLAWPRELRLVWVWQSITMRL